jgi:hypothetical protein
MYASLHMDVYTCVCESARACVCVLACMCAYARCVCARVHVIESAFIEPAAGREDYKRQTRAAAVAGKLGHAVRSSHCTSASGTT